MKNLRKFFKKTFFRGLENKEITLEQLKNMQKNGILIIDVRSPQEFNESHIDGAISIPEYEIKRRITEFVQDKKETIVVYCSSGMRSKNAQMELQRLGYENVYNLKGGIII